MMRQLILNVNANDGLVWKKMHRHSVIKIALSIRSREIVDRSAYWFPMAVEGIMFV